MQLLGRLLATPAPSPAGTERDKRQLRDLSPVMPALGNKAKVREFVWARAAHSKEDNPMGIFSKDIKKMDDLFAHTLQDIYYAENQIVKSLPNMIEKATDSALILGRADCASVLQQTLDEEKATDSKLTELAERQVNRKAA
jgi:hypothetical protein